ncbi:lipopolysaccharide biosynthesis protein [Patescibacteria group bacterium]
MSKNLTKKTIKASSWLFSHTAIARAGGLLKTAIIARILTPTQFGVFGIASLSLGLLETFSETSIDQALIQKKDLSEKDLTTAWYISILRGFAISLILFLSAPLISSFFKDDSASMYIKAIALAPLIRNFANPKISLLRRKLKFKKEFIMRTITTFVEVSVGVIVSIYTKSPWGLVASIVSGAISDVIISFIIISPPKISLPDKRSGKELVSFSSWLWASSIIEYLVSQGDDILVGKILGVRQLGFYQNAFKIASLPATQVTNIASQVVYPAFSSIQDNKERLKRAFKKSFITTSGLALLASAAIILFAKPLTLIILGEQWIEIVPALKILTVYGAIRSVASVAGPIIKALGKPKIITNFALIRMFVLAAFIYPLTKRYGIEGTSWAVLISTILPQPYLIFKVKKLLNEK